MRLDTYISLNWPVSRSQAARIIASGAVTVNSLPATKSTDVDNGDNVELASSALSEIAAADTRGAPEPTPADFQVLFEDEHLIVVNKPVGMAAHSGPGWEGPTVIGALLASGRRVSTSGPVERTGIVHRLDAGTSGAMVVAKDEMAYGKLKNEFRYRRVNKTYHALAQGYPDPWRGTIDAPIGRAPGRDFRMCVDYDGKPAITRYETLEVFAGATLLEVRLETGRTHQIRVHFSALKHPLLGDALYGADPVLARRAGVQRQWLHAFELGFHHPLTGEYLNFQAPYPDDLCRSLEVLRSGSHLGGSGLD